MSLTEIISFLLILALLGVACVVYGWFGFVLIAVIIIATIFLTREVCGGR